MMTPAEVRESFDYDPESGVVACRDGGRFHTHNKGYLFRKIDGQTYYAHRLAWACAHGEWPPAWIDHRNGNPADNRLQNLRAATPAENQQNRQGAQSNNRCGLLGVSLHGKRWRATIKPPGERRIRIGPFDTPEEAHAAYLSAKAVVHPFARST